MLGKSLKERNTLGLLPPPRAIALLHEVLETQAKHLVEVRAADPRMIACLVVRADALAVRFCRSAGIRVKLGGTGVFGLLGADATRVLSDLSAGDPAWLTTACGPRETKVLLVADGGVAFLSLATTGGKVTISVP